MKLPVRLFFIVLMVLCSVGCGVESNGLKGSVQTENAAYSISIMQVKTVSKVEANVMSGRFTDEIRDCKFQDQKSWNFGFTDKVIWVHFGIKNLSDPLGKVVAWINHIYLGQVDAFVGHDCRELKSLGAYGLNRPIKDGESTIGGYALELDLPQHTYTELYLRIESKFPLNLPIKIMSQNSYRKARQSLELMLTFYGAFVLALMLYNFLLFYVTRERTFLYYVFTLLGLHFFTNLAQYGLLKNGFFPNFLLFQKNTFHFAHVLSLITVTLFISSFFDKKIIEHQLKYFWSLALATIPLSVIGVLTNFSVIDLLMQINTTVFSIFLLIWVGYLAYSKKHRPAVYFFVAWSFLICAWIINFLKIDGVLSDNSTSNSFILVGAAMECLLLSLAIADRIRQLTKERNQMLSQLDLVNERERIFRQVSHDIRSPLSALEMILDQTHTMQEECRILARSAMTRIRDVANNLLLRESRAVSAGENHMKKVVEEVCTPILLTGLIDSLVSEKRFQFRSKLGLEIGFEVKRESYGLFSLIVGSEMKRVLSNLINNSYEAIDEVGIITVNMWREADKIKIEISDTGKGIPKEILPQLGKNGVSFGKSDHSESGSGLGLYHARVTIESWGGSLSVHSIEGQGSRVLLTLPKSSAPEWFLEKIALESGKVVLIADDDPSIHHVWESRFQSFKENDLPINIIHVSTPGALEVAIQSGSPDLCLVDQEFIGEPESGLDVIENLGIATKAVLVTRAGLINTSVRFEFERAV